MKTASSSPARHVYHAADSFQTTTTGRCNPHSFHGPPHLTLDVHSTPPANTTNCTLRRPVWPSCRDLSASQADADKKCLTRHGITVSKTEGSANGPKNWEHQPVLAGLPSHFAFKFHFFVGGNVHTDSKEVGKWVDGEDLAQTQHRVISMGMMNVILVDGRQPRIMPSSSKRQKRTRGFLEICTLTVQVCLDWSGENLIHP